MESETSSLITVARVVKSHGIKGEVVLQSYTDVEGRLENTPAFFVLDRGASTSELKVESRRMINGRHVIKFAEINNRTDADRLRGKELAIPESEIAELPEDHFYIHDLIGMKVRTTQGTEVGTVCNIMRTGGVDLLEIGEQRNILVPFVDSICIEVDTDQRIITINPPEGLLQLNAR